MAKDRYNFDYYLIETLQDYFNYKQIRKRKEEEIKSIKKEKRTICEKIDAPSIVGEDDITTYYVKRNSNLIDAILSYVEDMSPSEIDDVKAIQLMLLKLLNGKCDSKTYNRILNVDRMVAKKATNNFKFGTGSNNHIYAGGSK